MDWKDEYLWWQRGVVYQIYPRSFQDTDADGCGDLEGIRARLDHLSWLGVDAIWISPIYPSPMNDFGYDVADYTGVHPLFGDIEDFDRLLDEAHDRGLKVILDLVPNHSSDQHPWFQASSSSREDPKRDWYIWADPGPDGGPPNNWLAEFGGRAWQWHEETGQYYYHAFLPSQPDLNWRNPEVREAMADVMRFWLDRGVDGFRVDVMWHMVKDEHLRDNPPNPDWDPEHDSPYDAVLPVYSTDQPEVHEVVAEMRRVVDAYDERLMIGEIYLPIDRLVTYYGEQESEAHLPFNFQLIRTPWDAAHVRRVVDEYEASLPAGGWPNWVLGNHDQSRIASRVGRAQARVAAMLLLTLRGTPTVYYGDEIGMRDVPISAEQAVDPRELRCPGRGLGRDPERAPMPWSSGKNAGFTEADTPWLPMPDDAAEINVARQREQPGSSLQLHRRLLALRKEHAALAVGAYAPLAVEPPCFGYLRRHGDEALMVLLNFSSEPARIDPVAGCDAGEVLVSTHEVTPEGRRIDGAVELRPDEGLLVRLDDPPVDHPHTTMDEGSLPHG